MNSGVSYQEVSNILEQVKLAMVEYKNMLKTAEIYLDRNGIKQEYAKYLESRLAEVESKNVNRDISKVGKSEQKSMKEVNKTRGR